MVSKGSDEAGARRVFTPAPHTPPPLPQLPGEEKSRMLDRGSAGLMQQTAVVAYQAKS